MGIVEESSKPMWDSVSHKPSGYALNGKIMLSSVIILFVAVIMILCFQTYARWLFRRQNRRIRRRIRAHLRSLSTSSTVSSSLSPLDPAVLEKIPIFVYSSKTHLDECSVCLSEFVEEDEGRLLPKCRHAFHVDCIDTWFKSRSTCPLCRAPVQPETPSTRPESTQSSSTSSSSSSSSSSSYPPLRFPMEACERDPIDLIGITVESIPRELEGPNPVFPSQNGSKFPGNRVLSLKRLWSI